jgi:hypothetical protein
MLKKLLNTKRKKKIALKKHTFFQFAGSIGAIDTMKLDEISIGELLFSAYEFLNKEMVIPQKREKELLVFKDQYNRYVEYCIDEKLVQKGDHRKIDELHLVKVPDMSRIEVPDISKELQEMNIDLKELGAILGNLQYK